MVIFILTITFAVVAAIYFGRRAYILAGLLADSESARTADQEYYESIESVNEYMFSQIESAYNKMTEIDRLGAFANDDEAMDDVTFSRFVCIPPANVDVAVVDVAVM